MAGMEVCCYMSLAGRDERCALPAPYEVVEPGDFDLPDFVAPACVDHAESIRRECEAGGAAGYVIRTAVSGG
jgi:hypothetical protein